MPADCDLKLHFWGLFHSRGFINFPHFIALMHKLLITSTLYNFTNLLRLLKLPLTLTQNRSENTIFAQIAPPKYKYKNTLSSLC